MQVLPWAGISISDLTFCIRCTSPELHLFVKYIYLVILDTASWHLSRNSDFFAKYWFGDIRLLPAENSLFCILYGVLLISSAWCRENLSVPGGNLNIRSNLRFLLDFLDFFQFLWISSSESECTRQEFEYMRNLRLGTLHKNTSTPLKKQIKAAFVLN